MVNPTVALYLTSGQARFPALNLWTLSFAKTRSCRVIDLLTTWQERSSIMLAFLLRSFRFRSPGAAAKAFGVNSSLYALSIRHLED